MIKQFNFYDVYGYLLPGVALLGLLWIPIGIVSKNWPDQDISKALFLAALAYFLGHVLQTIANIAIPSKVMRDANHPRYPSDRLLDKSCPDLGDDFKTRLAGQVRDTFGLDLQVADDGDGAGDIFRNRNTAFFQARSYLIAKKTAHYVEQFEGLYAMMRGLACSLLAGACYLAGWSMAFHRDQMWVCGVLAALPFLATLVALVSALVALSRKTKVSKAAVVTLAFSLLTVFLSAGFWTAVWQSDAFWKSAPPHVELILWATVSFTLVAAARCFSSYRSFAIQFAQSVWRDFSVYLTVQEGKDSDKEPSEKQ